MSGFSSDWLALRERVDAAARSTALLETLPRRHSMIVDLGTGTGSNLRWLSPRLDAPQDWLLIENDTALIEAAPAAIDAWAGREGYSVATRELAGLISGDSYETRYRMHRADLVAALADLTCPDGCLLTASALLDLVSRDWLSDLVDWLAVRRASVLWTLSYDGALQFSPRLEYDDRIAELQNLHQLTDKGFGPALGPSAWHVARELLQARGYSVTVAASDWHCSAAESELISALIDGWCTAACEMAPQEKKRVSRWRSLRLHQLDAGELAVVVGHRDIAAVAGA